MKTAVATTGETAFDRDRRLPSKKGGEPKTKTYPEGSITTWPDGSKWVEDENGNIEQTTVSIFTSNYNRYEKERRELSAFLRLSKEEQADLELFMTQTYKSARWLVLGLLYNAMLGRAPWRIPRDELPSVTGQPFMLPRRESEGNEALIQEMSGGGK